MELQADLDIKTILYNDYNIDKLSIRDIANKYDISPTTVCYWIKFFDINKHNIEMEDEAK